jgi:hypothetical protein
MGTGAANFRIKRIIAMRFFALAFAVWSVFVVPVNAADE